jgi:hypothetical protein
MLIFKSKNLFVQLKKKNRIKGLIIWVKTGFNRNRCLLFIRTDTKTETDIFFPDRNRNRNRYNRNGSSPC